jgi:hypothetical protein
MSLAANLVMDGQTLHTLDRLAKEPTDYHDGAVAMLRALNQSVWVGQDRYRVPCSEAALEYIRMAAPEIAARFPAVFRQ